MGIPQHGVVVMRPGVLSALTTDRLYGGLGMRSGSLGLFRGFDGHRDLGDYRGIRGPLRG